MSKGSLSAALDTGSLRFEKMAIDLQLFAAVTCFHQMLFVLLGLALIKTVGSPTHVSR